MSKEIKVELIPKHMSSKQRLVVFLVNDVSIFVKNITAFLVVAGLIEGYMLITSTDAIVSSSLFIPNYISISFRSDA